MCVCVCVRVNACRNNKNFERMHGSCSETRANKPVARRKRVEEGWAAGRPMSHRPLLSIGMPATNKRPLEDDEPSTSQNFDFNRNETHEIFKVVPDAKHVVLSTKVKEGLQTALNAMKRVVISMEGTAGWQWMSWGEDVEQHIIARYKDIEIFTSTWTTSRKCPWPSFPRFGSCSTAS